MVSASARHRSSVVTEIPIACETAYVAELSGGSPRGRLGQQHGCGVLNRVVDQQAFMLSPNDIFYVSRILFLILIGVVWFGRPEKVAPVRGDGANHSVHAREGGWEDASLL